MTKWAILLSSTLLLVSLGLVLQLWAFKITFDSQALHDQQVWLYFDIFILGAN